MDAPSCLSLPGQKEDRKASARAQEALLCDMALGIRRSFYPLGFEVEILTNDARVMETAEQSFGHNCIRHGNSGLQIRVGVTKDGATLCPQEPTRREYDHLYSLVADQKNQALLDLQTGTNFTWLNECAVENRLYFQRNFLEKVVYLLLGSFVVTDLHAGCVSRNGKGVLLCGDSGAGKSTLSYACARAGWIYTSDDTVYFVNASESLRVVGHAHRVRFRPAAKELFPELAHHSITSRIEGKPSIEVPVSDLPAIKSSAEADIFAVVYLRRYPEAKRGLKRLPRGSATDRMCDELYSAGSIRARHALILKRFADVPSYDLHYCSLDEAIAELENLMDEL